MQTVDHNEQLPGRDTTTSFEARDIKEARGLLTLILQRAYGIRGEDDFKVPVRIIVHIDRTKDWIPNAI